MHPARPGLPPENIYAHTKKLRYVLAELERVRARRGEPVRLLDFGCGNGMAVSRFLIGPGVRYYGVDVHGPSREHAEAELGSEVATFHAGVPEGVEFDLIVYADVLEHLDDPVAVLREHARRLAPGGTIVGAVPNGYGPFEMEHRLIAAPGVRAAIRLAGRLRRALRSAPEPLPLGSLPYNHESGHVQFFTRRTLARALAAGGFEITRFGKGAFVGAPVSNRFLLRGERVARANARVSEFLPVWAVSTWYFTARLAQPSERGPR